jgi:hypothetical protein
MPGASAIGIFAKIPMQKLVNAAIAAVPVTKSLLISCVHDMYVEYPAVMLFKQ